MPVIALQRDQTPSFFLHTAHECVLIHIHVHIFIHIRTYITEKSKDVCLTAEASGKNGYPMPLDHHLK